MDSVKLIKNTFIVEDEKSFIVFSPFTGKITRVKTFPNQGTILFSELSNNGFFGNMPGSTKRDDLLTWNGFRSLTLLVTRRCNLLCSYCYAGAKQDGDSMSLNLAVDALRWFYNQLRDDTLRISFHGGGEPTLEMDLIREIVLRARALSQNGNKKLRLSIVTNGTADEGVMSQFVDDGFSISISADGPPDIQNKNRPFADGSPSSEKIERTIGYLVSRRHPFTIRITYSATEELSRIVEYFGELGVKSLHIEALFPFGREYRSDLSLKNGRKEIVPLGDVFIKSFLSGMDVAKKFGIKITNSHLGHLLKGLGYFCGSASGRSMIVTHDGFISGCLEVVDSNDQDFRIFKLGEFTPSLHSFVLDKDVLKKFQDRHSNNLSPCKNCFARYVCAGGCAVKAVRNSGCLMTRDISYCLFTKRLLPAVIKRIAILSNV